MSTKATVAHAELDRYRRAIVVSDIHGDNRGFLAMLRQTGFCQQDALVIVGDILEKGTLSSKSRWRAPKAWEDSSSTAQNSRSAAR